MFVNNTKAKTMQKHPVDSMKAKADSVRLKKAWSLVRGGPPPQQTTPHPNNRNAATGVKTVAPTNTGFKNRVGKKV